VQVYDPKAPKRRRWLGTFETEREAVDAERAARLGITPSGRARTIRDWSMVWLHDYPRPAVASRRTYRYAVVRINQEAGDLLLERVDRPTARRLARRWPNGTTRAARTMFADALRDGVIAANPFNFRVVRQRWGERDRLELYELRHACATLLLERGLPPHVVANQLGIPTAARSYSACTGTHPSAECASRPASPSASVLQNDCRAIGESLETAGFRSDFDPPSPPFGAAANNREFAGFAVALAAVAEWCLLHSSRRTRCPDQRSDRKAARSSSEKSCGCSQAAKWPPLSTSLK
jgi:hypothetical protein